MKKQRAKSKESRFLRADRAGTPVARAKSIIAPEGRDASADGSAPPVDKGPIHHRRRRRLRIPSRRSQCETFPRLAEPSTLRYHANRASSSFYLPVALRYRCLPLLPSVVFFFSLCVCVCVLRRRNGERLVFYVQPRAPVERRGARYCYARVFCIRQISGARVDNFFK